MNKYEIRTQKKKDAIIAASLDLFKQYGYTNVSINRIAETSGISTVSIYNYFTNKEGLISECIKVLMHETNVESLKILKQKSSFKSKLLKVVALCSTSQSLLLEEIFSPEACKDNVLLDLLYENISQIRTDIIRGFIISGKEEGAIDESVSTDTVMEYINAISNINISSELVSNKNFPAELYHLVLYGLIGK